MKTLLSLLSLSALLIPSLSAAEGTAYSTQFSLSTEVGETTSHYSLSERRRVVLPNGVNWVCSSIPVSINGDGSVYSAGFVCVNGDEDIINVQASCFSGRVDYEQHKMALTNKAADVGVVVFKAECRTTADEQPTFRRSTQS
jgi:hypothetical protein